MGNDNNNQYLFGKNINTGTNYGQIGDNFYGIKQRSINESELEYLISEIEKFKREYSTKINNSHITIGFPGDKESSILAGQVANCLIERGYKVQPMTLVTYGVVGKKFGVSNAPDDTILVEIYPADNV